MRPIEPFGVLGEKSISWGGGKLLEVVDLIIGQEALVRGTTEH